MFKITTILTCLCELAVDDLNFMNKKWLKHASVTWDTKF